jgi:AbrB family looped-hinge helix DNA binding protein
MRQCLTPGGPTKEIVATITSKGQVAIPAEVRKNLGLNKREKIAFVIDEEGDVHLKTLHYPTVAALRGAAGSLPLAHFRVQQRRMVLRALELYGSSTSGFGDAMLLAAMEQARSTTLYSYDEGFDKVAGLTRLEP